MIKKIRTVLKSSVNFTFTSKSPTVPCCFSFIIDIESLPDHIALNYHKASVEIMNEMEGWGVMLVEWFTPVALKKSLVGLVKRRVWWVSWNQSWGWVALHHVWHLGTGCGQKLGDGGHGAVQKELGVWWNLSLYQFLLIWIKLKLEGMLLDKLFYLSYFRILTAVAAASKAARRQVQPHRLAHLDWQRQSLWCRGGCRG